MRKDSKTSTYQLAAYKREMLYKMLMVRICAKAIDLAVAAFLLLYFYPSGVLLAVFYLSVSDAFEGKGHSLGKKMLGFRVIEIESKCACSIYASFKRNIIFTVPILISIIPFLGWILGPLTLTLMVLFELSYMFRSEEGERWGDLFAQTTVLNSTDETAKKFSFKTERWFATSNSLALMGQSSFDRKICHSKKIKQ